MSSHHYQHHHHRQIMKVRLVKTLTVSGINIIETATNIIITVCYLHGTYYHHDYKN
jgi:hypothetical protein